MSYLETRAGEIRTEHDYPWRVVVEVGAAALEAIFEEFDVTTTTVAACLVFDFVLNNKGFVLEVNGLREGSGDSVVGGFVLGNKAQVTLDGTDEGLLDLPFADIAEGLATNGTLLGRLRGCPAFTPVLSELFDEGCLDLGGLHITMLLKFIDTSSALKHTLNMGLASSAATTEVAARVTRAEIATLRMTGRRTVDGWEVMCERKVKGKERV